MRIPLAAKVIPVSAAVAVLGSVLVSEVSSSVPGDTTYGIKEAVIELRTALASGGEDRSDRYLDEVDLSVTELDLLAKQGAPAEQVEEVAERAVTTERHAQAELSDQTPDPQAADRYHEHRQNLTNTLKHATQPAVRDSLREILRALPQGDQYGSR